MQHLLLKASYLVSVCCTCLTKILFFSKLSEAFLLKEVYNLNTYAKRLVCYFKMLWMLFYQTFRITARHFNVVNSGILQNNISYVQPLSKTCLYAGSSHEQGPSTGSSGN